jgi:hypothetical protein
MSTSRRRCTALLCGTVLLANACRDGTDFAGALCPTVQRWSDDSVTAVNLFQEDSPALDGPVARRARYLKAFADLHRVVNRFDAALGDLPYPEAADAELRARLRDAAVRVKAEYDDDLAEARGLPDEAYAGVQVNDGHLFTGNEKAKAIVFDAVGSIWRDFGLVDENCGRHDPVTVDDRPG